MSRSLSERFALIVLGALLALTIAIDASAQAQADLPIYTDAPLANGWQDSSWATVNFASTTTVHGGSTSISVAAGPWAALSLQHDPFGTAGYGSLTFWINGGNAGQARLLVTFTLDHSTQATPAGMIIGPIPANTWQQISIPLASFGIDNVPNFTGFWIQDGTGTDQTLNPFYVDDIVLTAAAPTTPAPALDGGMALYDDSFASGWMNWSWASVDPANPSPVNSGTSSIAVTATAPYQGLAFHHADVETQSYASLTFWIDGGPTGGQVLALVASVGGVSQPSVTVGPLAPGVWQKVVVPLASLGAANVLNLSDIWLIDISGAEAPTYYVDDVRLDLAPAPSAVNVVVDPKSRIRTVDARTFGLNTAIWDGALATPTTVDLLDEIDVKALRFPGGSIADIYHWQTNTSNDGTVWATPFDAFATTATSVGAQVFVTVNYGTGTPEEAAAWVFHSNRESSYGFKYWEIGNENYGAWEADTNTRPNDPVTYATRFAEYARQMKAKDPSIKIGAVITNSEDSSANYADEVVTNPRTGLPHSGWSAVVLATLRQLGVTPDFVDYHRYEQGPGGESDAFLLDASRGWAADATAIRQMLNDYLGARAKRVEIDSTEANSVYATPGKQTTSLVNGLFLADSIGNVLKTEFNSYFLWDLRNGPTAGNESSSLYGWRLFGDYGIVDAAVPAGPADRYPTFYVYKLLQYFARGGEAVLDASSDYNGLGAYAVRDAGSQTLNLLLINKYPLGPLNASVSINGVRCGGAADVYSYGIPQDDAARTGVGSADVAHTTVTLTGPTFTYAVAPYSAVVIRLKQAGPR
jgi:alpha-N-arabinofuranosidase